MLSIRCRLGLTIAVAVISCALVVESRLEERFVWNELQFAWPSAEAKEAALQSEAYVPKNNLPLGLDVWRNKLFITVPRWKTGIASPLNYILLDNNTSVLYPYPSWEANILPPYQKTGQNMKDKNLIISTFRVRVDECDRLWVVDTGLADITGEELQYQPPSIYIFDLNTDKLIRRYFIPENSVKDESAFANIHVDVVAEQCENAFAYLPDLATYSVIVYSFKENKSWRIKHNFFHIDPFKGDFHVGGISFHWSGGVFSLAIGKHQLDGSRPVYFHAFASTKQFVVSNLVLQNETYATSWDSYHEFKLLGDKGENSQATASFYDPMTETLFYSQVNKNAIGCWNTNKPFTVDNQGVIDRNEETLVFTNDLKVDPKGNLWVLSDRMPIYLYGDWDETQKNYRVLTGKTSELIKNSPCGEQE